jgi:hypothetical protein
MNSEACNAVNVVCFTVHGTIPARAGKEMNRKEKGV